MSALTVSEIISPTGVFNIPSSTVFKYKGWIGSSAYVTTDSRATYSAPASGNGTTVTDLNLTITPKSADSLILLTWMINGEAVYNTTWTIHQNGSLITTSGYEAYNRLVGNSRWSGVITSMYDRNDSSTPSNLFIQFAVPAGSTSSRTYAPAIRSSNGTAYTLYLNRPISSTGADDYEVSVSNGVALEIYQ